MGWFITNTTGCLHPRTLPPTFTVLIAGAKSPTTFNTLIDREVTRCKLCDLSIVRNRIAGIDCTLEIAKRLVEGYEGMLKDTDTFDIPTIKSAQRRLPEAVLRYQQLARKYETTVSDTWKEFWAIWGREGREDELEFDGIH